MLELLHEDVTKPVAPIAPERQPLFSAEDVSAIVQGGSKMPLETVLSNLAVSLKKMAKLRDKNLEAAQELLTQVVRKVAKANEYGVSHNQALAALKLFDEAYADVTPVTEVELASLLSAYVLTTPDPEADPEPYQPVELPASKSN